MDQEIKKLLEDNLAMNKEILLMTQDIKKHIRWQKIFGVIRIVIIIIPIALAIIYIPPFISNALGSYKDLLELGIGSGKGALDIGSILDRY